MARTFGDIVLEQIDLHPGYAVVDLYKLIHQAIFGIAHLLKDEKRARKLLSEEFGKVGRQLPGERLLESIDPEGTLCRMNLRPYRATGGTLESLFDAMLLTQHTVNGTRSDFFRLWREAKKLRKTRLLPFGLDEMEKFELLLQQRGLPVLHHSESYVRFNHPAYRVVASEHALDLVEG